MTEEDTFDMLRRTPYSELKANVRRRGMGLRSMITYVESNHWTWIEYIEAIYIDPESRAREGNLPKTMFVDYWVQEYNRIKTE